jgi:predicted alpha/beta-hydrolase family hydrolase
LIRVQGIDNMNTDRFQLNIGDDGVSAEWVIPDKPVAAMTLAHGAGAGMDHPFMKRLAEELARLQIATLRFNFLYMEKRSKRPDPPARTHAVISAAADVARKTFPNVPLLLSGKSFGGRMSSQWLAAHPDRSVNGTVFFGFPLHPPGKPGTERADHLKNIDVPMLFLQGTRDEFATHDLLNGVCGVLPGSSLRWFEGADHSFKCGKQDLIPELAKAVLGWLPEI